MTFSQKMAQLGGVIRYEALMQFRRRTILVLGLFFIIGAVGLTSMLQSGNMGVATQEILQVEFEGENVTLISRMTETGEIVRQTMATDSEQGSWIPRWYGDVDFPQVMTTWRIFAVLSASLLLILIAVPPMLSEVIPLDKHYQVREVMDASPLARSTYLIGKVAGTWLGIGAVTLICAILFGVYSWVTYGAFELWTYARFWLVIVLPMALIITGFAVVVPAVARSRRVGVLMGIGLLVVSMLMAMALIPGTFLAGLFSPQTAAARTASYEEIVAGMLNSLLANLFPYAVALLVVSVIVWAWMRFKESYA